LTNITYNNALALKRSSLWDRADDNPGWYFWVWQAKIFSDPEN